VKGSGALLLMLVLVGGYVAYLVWRNQAPRPGGGGDLAPPRLAGTLTAPIGAVPVRVQGFTA